MSNKRKLHNSQENKTIRDNGNAIATEILKDIRNKVYDMWPVLKKELDAIVAKLYIQNAEFTSFEYETLVVNEYL